MNSSARARGADALALTAPGAGAASLTAIEARRFDEQDEDGEGKQPIDIDADRLRHTTIIDGGTNLGTDIGPLEAVPEHGNQHGTNQDDESAVGRARAHTDIDLPGEKARKRDGLRARPIEIGVGSNRHECEADGKQHLVELTGLVQARIKRALEEDADGTHRDESERERGHEADAPAARQRYHEVTARHGKRAM